MLNPYRILGPYISRWPYPETLAIVWKTSESSTRLTLILNPSNKTGFRIKAIITFREEKITTSEEGQKLVLTERISPLS